MGIRRVAAAAGALGVFALAAWACSSSSDGAGIADAGGGPGDGTTAPLPEAAVEAAPPGDDAAPGDAGSAEDAGAETGAPPPGDGGRDFSTDRSTFFGDSRCADAGLQLCEDFESGKIDTSVWTVSGTKPAVDTLQHARGTHALHITMSGNGQSYLIEKKTFPEPNDTYFGRMFVYFASLPAPPGMTYSHWTVIGASGSGVSGEIRVSGQLQNGKNLWGVGTDNRVDDAGTGDWTTSDDDPKGHPTAVPLNQWLCIEWMHEGDTSETQLWWDDVLHPSLSTSPSVNGGNGNPFILPQFKQVWVGWDEYQTSTEPFELWIDEVAIDTRRIGCVL